MVLLREANKVPPKVMGDAVIVWPGKMGVALAVATAQLKQVSVMRVLNMIFNLPEVIYVRVLGPFTSLYVQYKWRAVKRNNHTLP